MKTRFSSLQQILDLFETQKSISASEISQKLSKGRTIIHKYLKILVEKGKLEKIGKVPKVSYILGEAEKKIQGKIEVKTDELPTLGFGYQEKIFLEKVFLKFSPTGKLLSGISGIHQWCMDRSLNVSEKIQDYLEIARYIESQHDECGMFSADEAFGKDFEEKYLDRVVYADQYNYMDFGRGKLAELTFYAKQSQNKKLIAEAIAEIFPKLECSIQREKFDAIAITPWSIERKNQLLGALRKELSVFGIPFIRVIKYSSSGIFIPQKSLKTRQERIENAKSTIFIDDENAKKYKKILLIDDFVGSGATLNETAKKLKEAGGEIVYGFAFVGNTNLSYEIIREI